MKNDVLDMNHYRIEKLPKMQKSRFEVRMVKRGIPLALPVSMLIEHVYVLPFNNEPAALLYNTNQYSQTDAFKYGFTMMVFSWLLILLWGETVLKKLFKFY